MRYLSPYSLPDSPPISPPDKKALMLQRSKLLAELELSPDRNYHIKNQSLSKNDILEYFETLQDDTILHYHAQLSNDVVLVTFLEEGKLLEDTSFHQAELYEDKHFLEWVSPYFYTAFTEYVPKCLQNRDVEGLRTLLQNRLLLTGYDGERAWTAIMQLLENNISRLAYLFQQSNEHKTPLPAKEIMPLADERYIRVILVLPETRFTDVRNKYSVALIRLSVGIFNQHNGNWLIAKKWMNSARLLAISEELVAEIEEHTAQMVKIRRKARSGVLSAIFVISVIVIKVCSINYPSTETPKINPMDSVLFHFRFPDTTRVLRYH